MGHIFGISAVFLYNYFACLLRAVGNSFIPLVFLGISALLNVGLDLVFVLVFNGVLPVPVQPLLFPSLCQALESVCIHI